MKATKILNTVGCVITIGFGLLGLLFPEKASELTGLQATAPRGMAEFRGTFGGAFVLMGVLPLLAKQPIAYLLSGLIWWGAVAGRIISLFADNGFSDSQNFGGLAFEFLFGLLLVFGNWKSLSSKN